MKAAAVAAAFAVPLVASAPFAEGAGAPAPRVALSASPPRIVVGGPSARRVQVRNLGRAPVVVDTTRAGLGRAPATRWVAVVPRRLTLAPGRAAALTVRVAPPRRAAPGDHHAVVLLTTRPLRGARVAVRMRVGIVVRARVPGAIVRRLELRSLRVRRTGRARVLVLTLTNRGNVSEPLRRRVAVSILRRGRRVARFAPRAPDLLPGTRRTLEMRYRGRVRGAVTAVVAVRGAGIARYRLRL